MNPETFCGASEEHVHFNNQQLTQGQPIKLFGISGIDEKTLWLGMENCSGVIDSDTFSLLPCLESLTINKCNIEQSVKPFACLQNLSTLYITKTTFPLEAETFEGNNSITCLSLENMELLTTSKFQNLDNLKTISFDKCTIEMLNGDMFSNLKSLKGLSISNCKIQEITSDVFDYLPQLKELDIRDNIINGFDFNSITKLTNLTFVSFHHNDLGQDGDVNYTILTELPDLETVHLDSDIYKTLNFDSFPKLKNIRIGYDDDDKEEDPELSELIKNLNSKGINSELVFCGKVDYDSDEMVECC